MDFYIDMNKALLNTAKLVKRSVQVHGKNGKTFTRMQWIDPNDNMPVMEHHTHEDDDHHKLVEGLHPHIREDVARDYLDHNKDHAHKFAQATGMRRDPANVPYARVVNHIAEHLHKVPRSHIKLHMDKHVGEEQKNSVNHPKLGIKHTDHRLPDKELDKRTGKEGSLDLSKLTKGTDPTAHSRFDEDWKWADENLESGDAKRAFRNIFKNTTVEGLEHVFSHPDGEFTAKLTSITAFNDDPDTELCEIGLDLHDRDMEHMGSIIRRASRDEDGTLHIFNEEMNLRSEHQGKGVADHIYNRCEQYWRHLSDGNPVNIHLTANISVGVYAWAKKGFDFENDRDLTIAHQEFSRFLKKNNMSVVQVLQDCGKSGGLDDLKHSWDFATLDDGRKYDLQSLVGSDRIRFKGEIKGAGHLGKAFMLGGKSNWGGVKKLNQSGPHEKVHEIHKQAGERNG